ncbi:DUF3995 domain-containing protein [Cohnella massiliensis]|uniref:DUF3995 domain-containing protein n=1 Tax=Cohnella massiliensis TaxID=1816691 RepID=UPI0009B9B933|nr:DUF3995 domain-containing protein [Cohnella massiliensis]
MVAWLALLVGIVSFILSGVHWYWVLGGKKGLLVAVPSREGEPLFRPSKRATGGVAALLAAMGLFVLQLGGYGEPALPSWLFSPGGWGLSAAFILRAVGDFKWLGFFKSRKGTPFAKWDALLYSPLCLLLGICLALITAAYAAA